MVGAHTSYIEWWAIVDKVSTKSPGTFTMRPNSLNYFLECLASGHRNIVFLRDVSTNKVLLDDRS